MEYFWTDGGNNNPWFEHRIKIPKVTDEMYRWCEAYPTQGKCFCRWHVEWGRNRQLEYDVIQFEWRQAAIDFSLRWL